MLGVSCPQCGRPTPIALSAPESMRCAACGYAGPTPEPARSHLVAARGALQSLDVRERQITDAQRLAYDAHYGRVVGSFWVLFVALTGFEGFAIAASIANHGTDDVLGMVAPVGGFVACALVGSIILLVVRRDRRRFESAYAANPPPVHGGDATCHVCGAPLPRAEAARGVVRCGFCHADNIVAPGVMGRMAKARRLVLEDHAREVARRTKRFGTAATVVGLSLLWILPPVTLGSHFGLRRLVRALDEALTDEARPFPIKYVIAGDYDCVHEIDARGRIRGYETGNRWVDHAGAAKATAFEARRLVDMLVSVRGSHVIGPEVIRTYGRTESKDNWAFCKNTSGDYVRAPVTSLCVTVVPHDFVKAP